MQRVREHEASCRLLPRSSVRTSMGRGCLMRWSDLRQFQIEVSVVVIVSFSIVINQSLGTRATRLCIQSCFCTELFASSFRTSPHEWNPFLCHRNQLLKFGRPTSSLSACGKFVLAFV